MALSYTRLLCRRNLAINNFRGFYTSKNLAISSTNTALERVVFDESHDQKNMRLKRPLSPHLTIYQVQITSLLSVTHRATGIILSGYAAIIGLSTLFMPGGVNCLIAGIHGLCLPTAVVLLGKTALAFPATFHFCNGIRHLAWDLGMFLTIKDVYTTGYIMVASAGVLAVVMALL
ncbi:succinate dehydrogenase cytochrome b560 subunit, mitochondrial-like [Athalia rosae]|uniref:succinate dehydrogenase cytochrome b560 subunit, mitochondrial-like n=1 Tax=Athalia rosae TaxID=37344 RepID=UPI0020336447|nr:succinate dehydrogenase cytochrome b560 subunit, mitochondrial-like [Athalia rosae]XP_012267667.2 succinate dehydrogenase cytochrome b560 subunit, mitochondrial-like [Athalia rosae]XP_048515370.1 succinate dehydrogenase cytochrome b560 subunit, mitochondrial-like [Athalia rosae]